MNVGARREQWRQEECYDGTRRCLLLAAYAQRRPPAHCREAVVDKLSRRGVMMEGGSKYGFGQAGRIRRRLEGGTR